MLTEDELTIPMQPHTHTGWASEQDKHRGAQAAASSALRSLAPSKEFERARLMLTHNVLKFSPW